MKRTTARPLFVQDSLALDRPLLDALGDRFRARGVEGWDATLALAAEAPASAVFVVDPYGGGADGTRLAPQLRMLLAWHPCATVVAALELRRGRAAAVRTLLRWGVAEVVATGVEDTPEAVAGRLRAAHARRFKRKLEGALAPHLTAGGHTLLLAAAETVADGGGSTELARVLRSTPRTVAERCRREGMPNPRRLLAWARLLLAAALLEEEGRTAAQVARACGYTTDGALRRAFRAFLSRGATALREEGAFASAARAFGAELRATRAGVPA